MVIGLYDQIWPVDLIPKFLSDEEILSAFNRAPHPKWIFSCPSDDDARKWEGRIRIAKKLAEAIADQTSTPVYISPDSVAGQTGGPETDQEADQEIDQGMDQEIDQEIHQDIGDYKIGDALLWSFDDSSERSHRTDQLLKCTVFHLDSDENASDCPTVGCRTPDPST